MPEIEAATPDPPIDEDFVIETLRDMVRLNSVNPFFGDDVDVTWTIRNRGVVEASGQWVDRILLSATWIDGTAGDDNPLNGTAAHDHLDGLAGNDSIFGLAGDDELRGGAGNDALDGGAGEVERVVVGAAGGALDAAEGVGAGAAAGGAGAQVDRH